MNKKNMRERDRVNDGTMTGGSDVSEKHETGHEQVKSILFLFFFEWLIVFEIVCLTYLAAKLSNVFD